MSHVSGSASRVRLDKDHLGHTLVMPVTESPLTAALVTEEVLSGIEKVTSAIPWQGNSKHEQG